MSGLVGHLSIQKSLSGLHKSGNMPHAILLSGPKGIGKRLVAEYFARMIICGEDPSDTSGLISFNTSHEYYPQFEAGSCADYLVIKPEEGKKVTSVEVVRNALKKLSLASEGKRVVIIDAANDMNNNAANALLKTLEEPGEGIHLILICHSISKMLPTIISRCRHFRASPLLENEMSQVLDHLFDDLSDQDKKTLVNISGGCPGEAIRLSTDGREVLQLLQHFLGATHSNPAIDAAKLADTISQKKKIPIAMEMLLQQLSLWAKNQISVDDKWAIIYTTILDRYTNMEVLNLTPQLVFETALMDVVKAKRSQ